MTAQEEIKQSKYSRALLALAMFFDFSIRPGTLEGLVEKLVDVASLVFSSWDVVVVRDRLHVDISQNAILADIFDIRHVSFASFFG